MQKLIKKKMIDAGRDDFVTYLSEILGCTRQTAGEKLNRNGKFSDEEISILTLKLGFSAEELRNAIVKE